MAGQIVLSKYILSLLDDGYRSRQIESYLMKQGHDAGLVKDMLREAIKIRKSKKILKALALVLACSVIFLSIVLVVQMRLFS